MDPLSIALWLASTAVSTIQAQQQAKKQRAAQIEQANEAAKQRWEEYEQAEKQRKDTLKKNLAKRRARMGAQGLSSTDGSAGAIIQGMRTDHAEERFEDFTNAKEGIDQSFSDIQKNLLETNDKIKKDTLRNTAFKVSENVFGENTAFDQLAKGGVNLGLS